MTVKTRYDLRGPPHILGEVLKHFSTIRVCSVDSFAFQVWFLLSDLWHLDATNLFAEFC